MYYLIFIELKLGTYHLNILRYKSEFNKFFV